MKKRLLLLATGMSLFAFSAPQDLKDLPTRARTLHHRLLTVDTHCDTPWNLLKPEWNIGIRHEPGKYTSGCQDLIRMKEGGLGASFFAAFISQRPLTPADYKEAADKSKKLLDALDKMFKEHSSLCERCLTPSDARKAHAAGKRAIFLGLENGYALGTDVNNVDLMYKRGVRYITLCHTSDNALCCSSTEKSKRPDTGLTALGREVVKRMNALGMMVDVSHVSDKTFFDVIQMSQVPVLASHSSARGICDHPRNLTDDQLRALKKNGGVAQVCLYADYIKKPLANTSKQKAEDKLENRVKAAGGWDHIKDPKLLEAFEAEWDQLTLQYAHELPTIKDAVDHIDHMVKVAGIDHVGVGSDFDGGGALRDCYDVTQIVGITEELMRRGYSDGDIAKIWGENALRVMEVSQKQAPKKS